MVCLERVSPRASKCAPLDAGVARWVQAPLLQIFNAGAEIGDVPFSEKVLELALHAGAVRDYPRSIGLRDAPRPA
jgi:hypothetical protein